ncbi:MAG: ATP-binding protein [Limnobacter sp.]|nr:ATP-binding protein [Limnobacter sp.]
MFTFNSVQTTLQNSVPNTSITDTIPSALQTLLPHGFCINWNPTLLAMHVGSDALIALAYFSIPISLIWISRRLSLGKLQNFYYLFATFILACGVTHVFGILTLWTPMYMYQGYAKVFTAVVSIITAGYMIPKLKTVLSLPNLDDLIQLNANLQAQISNNEKIQIELRDSVKKALEAQQTQAQFLANMSHEIRTPMNGVVGATALLLDTQMSEVQHSLTNTVRASANSLLKLLNDILDISKVESGLMTLSMSEFELAELFEEVNQSFGIEADRKNIELVCPIKPVQGLHIESDFLRLKQIVFNLVGNAIKFTDKGCVTLECEVLPNPADSDRGLLNLKIRDTGTGIPKEALGTVFDRFKQASHYLDSRNRGGTGLGLAIVRELIHLMGGNIQLRSELGVGTEVELSIPVKIDAQTKDKAPQAEKEQGSILIHIIATTPDVKQSLLNYLSILNCTPVHDLDDFLERCTVNIATDATSPTASQINKAVPILVLDYGKSLKDLSQSDSVVNLVQSGKLDLLTIRSVSHEREDSIEVERLRTHSIFRPISFKKIQDLLDNLKSGLPSGRSNTVGGFSGQAALSGKVLLVEDSIVSQKIVKLALEKRGLTVITANNGEEAIHYLRGNTADLVLMDGQMPIIDGYQATAMIREGQVGEVNQNLTIVALTAHAMEGEKERCLKLGMNDFLIKPLDLDHLDQILKRYLKQNDLGKQALP